MSARNQTRQYSTFTVGGLLLGLDVLNVQEVLRSQPFTRVPLAPPAVEGLLNLRGEIVTAVDLRKLLPAFAAHSGAEPMNVVVRYRHECISLQVDDIGDVS